MEWISLKERMPEFINETILLSNGEDVTPGFYSSDHEFMLNFLESCQECDFDVTHWMPLPPPPEINHD